MLLISIVVLIITLRYININKHTMNERRKMYLKNLNN